MSCFTSIHCMSVFHLRFNLRVCAPERLGVRVCIFLSPRVRKCVCARTRALNRVFVYHPRCVLRASECVYACASASLPASACMYMYLSVHASVCVRASESLGVLACVYFTPSVNQSVCATKSVFACVHVYVSLCACVSVCVCVRARDLIQILFLGWK